MSPPCRCLIITGDLHCKSLSFPVRVESGTIVKNASRKGKFMACLLNQSVFMSEIFDLRILPVSMQVVF